MRDVIILDGNFKPMLPVVDAYSSLQWTRRYYECGEFELHAPVEFCDLLKNGQYVYRNDAIETGLIEEFGYSLKDGGEENVFVKGRFLNALLDGRVIARTRNVSGNAEAVLRNLLNAHAINPTDTSRKIENLILGPLSGVGGSVNTQVTGDSLMEYFDKLSLEQELSYLLRYDFLQGKLVFDVWQGFDRTDGQTVNTMAVFSRDFENISEESYQRRDADYKNFAYVAGTGEGTARIVEIVNQVPSGERRREMYVDAHDLQPKDDDGNDITTTAYRAILYQRGLEKLKEQVVVENIDTAINQFGNLEYKQDFDLGDLCTIINPRIGYQTKQRITEVREIFEKGCTQIEAVFGTEKMTIKNILTGGLKMADIPMNERNIVYFPMQSVQIDTDEQGNPIYDNAADAEILQKLRQREIKDGVYPDDSTYLQVMSNNDMTVTVKAGYAHIQGVQVWMKEDVILTVEDADLNVDRIDRVALRLSLVEREVTLIIKKDSTSLTRIAGQVWELGLADLHVAKNNAEITQAEIDDLRPSPTACGVVSGLMQVDTSTIFNQYMTWWETQQNTAGYLTVDGDNSSLSTTSKKVLGAINELNEKKPTINGDYGRSIHLNDGVHEYLIYASPASNVLYIGMVNSNGGFIGDVISIGEGGDSNLVFDSGNQAISGVKTFSSFPVTPSAVPSSNYQVANKKYIDDNCVKLTGDQTVGGTKTFTGDAVLQKNLPKITFKTQNGTYNVAFYYNATDSTNADFNFLCDAPFRFRNWANSAYVAINASAFTVGSSYRWKDNINPFADAESRKLLDIELKTFSYKPEFSDDGGKIHMGVIAEQIAELFPDAVTFDEDGLPAGVDYSKLVVPCIGMIQQQQRKIDALTDLLISKGILTQEEIDNL